MKRATIILLMLSVFGNLSAQTFTTNIDGVKVSFSILDNGKKHVSYIYLPMDHEVEILHIPGTVDYKGETYTITEVVRSDMNTYMMQAGNQIVRRIILDEGIEVLGQDVFFKHSNLSNVKFPSTLRRIEENAFGFCAVRNIDIPESVEYIGERAFWGEQGNFVKVEDMYFRGTIRLPHHPLEIGSQAFAIVSPRTGRTAVSYFKILQLPKGTTYRQINEWYIGKGEDEFIEQAIELEKEREKKMQSENFDDQLDRIVEY